MGREFGRKIGSGHDASRSSESPPEWTRSGGMQDISTTGNGSCATGINDAGQVIGMFTVNSNFDNHAFIWTASTGMVDLGVPVSSNTYAASINNSGMVVGTYYSSTGGYHGFLWTQ